MTILLPAVVDDLSCLLFYCPRCRISHIHSIAPARHKTALCSRDECIPRGRTLDSWPRTKYYGRGNFARMTRRTLGGTIPAVS